MGGPQKKILKKVEEQRKRKSEKGRQNSKARRKTSDKKVGASVPATSRGFHGSG